MSQVWSEWPGAACSAQANELDLGRQDFQLESGSECCCGYSMSLVQFAAENDRIRE